MHGTRERVLSLIIERRSARVEDLAEEVGVSAAAVRRHLDHLRADGLVEVRTVKQGTGRPYHAYSPTEAAAGVIPPAYADLLERMLRSLDTDAEIGRIATGVAESLASRHRGDVPDDMLDEETRIRLVTDSLRADGILDHWHRSDDGYHLVNEACPYRRAAEISHLPCESDRQAIELLVGRSVEQRERIVDGAPCCEYVVAAGQSTETGK